MARPIVLSGWGASYDRRGGRSKWIRSAVGLEGANTFCWFIEPREFHPQKNRTGELGKRSSDNLWYMHSTFSGYVERRRQPHCGFPQDRVIHRFGNIHICLRIFVRWTDIWNASIVVKGNAAPPTIRLASVRLMDQCPKRVFLPLSPSLKHVFFLFSCLLAILGSLDTFRGPCTGQIFDRHLLFILSPSLKGPHCPRTSPPPSRTPLGFRGDTLFFVIRPWKALIWNKV